VAVLNSNDYYAKLESILADESQFIKINADENETHHMIVKENSVVYYILKYLKP